MKSPIYEAALRGSRCGCSSCGRVFASLAAFDKHRQVIQDTQLNPSQDPYTKQCTDPLTLGMQVKPHPTEIVYQFPPISKN